MFVLITSINPKETYCAIKPSVKSCDRHSLQGNSVSHSLTNLSPFGLSLTLDGKWLNLGSPASLRCRWIIPDCSLQPHTLLHQHHNYLHHQSHATESFGWSPFDLHSCCSRRHKHFNLLGSLSAAFPAGPTILQIINNYMHQKLTRHDIQFHQP